MANTEGGTAGGAGPTWKGLEQLFAAMAKNRASDLHIKAGQKPIFRVATLLHEVGNRVLTPEETRRLIFEILTPELQEHLLQQKDLDFAYSLEGVGRFRIAVFHDRGTLALAARRVNTEIPSFEELHLPEGAKRVCDLNQGLVILAGPTGSGKSTTLACVLEHINKTQRCHIITVEDPIEFLFVDKKSFINQREIGIDVSDFRSALKHVVRQDPDIILMGEMRDGESLDAGLTAAETGHLVFGTLHASSAAQAVGRMLDLYATDRQTLVRQALAFNLKSIICQKLMPAAKEGTRMVPAVEILHVNPIIQKLLTTGDDQKIHDVIRGAEEEGMQDFNQSLVKLINAGLVSKKVAFSFSPNPEQLKMNLQGIFLGEDHHIIG